MYFSILIFWLLSRKKINRDWKIREINKKYLTKWKKFIIYIYHIPVYGMEGIYGDKR